MLQRLQHPALSHALELTKVEVSPNVLVATLIVSTALGLGALALGMRMIFVALGVLVPWTPILARKLTADRLAYGWLAVFELLVVFQIAHFAEHVSQMIELHWLNWPTVLARGIISDLDTEPVHFWWNTAILFGATLLLMRYQQNHWLWASWVFSIWHELEHLYIYFVWFLPKGVSGHPGLLGAGGVLDEANISIPYLTSLSRPDLHFWYNLFEIGLFVIAFLWQAARTLRSHTRTERTVNVDQRSVLVLLGSAQVALITLLGLVYHSPVSLSVPQNYPTVQSAIDAAPDWAIIRIGPGTFNESLRISKPLTLVGSSRAATHLGLVNDDLPVIHVTHAHDVTIKNLSIDGGLYGVLVEESRAVQIANNAIMGSWLGGIRVSRAAAMIDSNDIVGTRSPYGMGIELANTVSYPDTVIRNNLIRGHPQEGIDTHNANSMITRNVIAQNGRRGIAITEMSMAMIKSNQVNDNSECGIFVIDHSMAELDSNQVRGPQSSALAGEGVRGDYYAELMLRSNVIQVNPGRELVLKNGATLEPWR